MSDLVVHLMRGLPACGKSHTARRLAGKSGVVLETDRYFYTEAGDDPTVYDYDDNLLPRARAWNFERFKQAIEMRYCPIVVDRGNGLNQETRQYALYAIEHGYRVELNEPDSEWWQEIRVLLKYKQLTRPVLEQWAHQLAHYSHATHRVPVRTILHWMDRWRSDLTVQDILDWDQNNSFAAMPVSQRDRGRSSFR